MYEEGTYLEQYCEDCRGETDQRMSPVPAVAICLRCGARNVIKPEDQRVGALIQRVREEDAASLRRLRDGVVPLF
jgi:hypothetical protein